MSTPEVLAELAVVGRVALAGALGAFRLRAGAQRQAGRTPLPSPLERIVTAVAIAVLTPAALWLLGLLERRLHPDR